MATATASDVKQGVIEVALGVIVPSRTNPRHNFPETYLHELAESIQRHGVVQAIVVRPFVATAEHVKHVRELNAWAGKKGAALMGPGDDVYEIVAGECRYRASLLAGKTNIRADIRDLTDDQVLEIQIIENLQRKDLDPLEEAEGYRVLQAAAPAGPGLRLEDIAKRIGKSISYVSARVKLCTLSEDGKEMLRKGWISPGHAILVARLDVSDQERALKAVFLGSFARPDKRPLLEIVTEMKADEMRYGDDEGGMSEKGLREWIRENVNLELKKAPWKLDDAELFIEAGACTTCPNKSGNDPALFAEITDDTNTCMKPACYQEKKKRFVQIEIDQAKQNEKPLQPISEKSSYTAPKEGAKLLKQGQWVESKKGECPSTIQGILMDGDTAGKKQYVCGDVKCKVHKHHVQSASNGESHVDREAKWQAERKKREEGVEREQKIRAKMAMAALDGVKVVNDRLVMGLVTDLLRESQRPKCWGAILDGLAGKSLDQLVKSKAQFARVTAAALIRRCVEPYYEDTSHRTEFHTALAFMGVDVAKLRKAAEAEVDAAAPKQAKPEKAAKPDKQAKVKKAKQAKKDKAKKGKK